MSASFFPMAWVVCRFVNARTRCAIREICLHKSCYGHKSCGGHGYSPLEQPPFKPMVILGKECDEIKALVEKTAAEENDGINDWNEVVKNASFYSVRPQVSGCFGKLSKTAAALTYRLSLPKRVGTFIGNREYAWRVFGYADKKGANDPTMIVGFEPWVLRLGLFKYGRFNLKPCFKRFIRSCVLHELEHCRQQLDPKKRLMDARWKSDLDGKNYRKLWGQAEWGAVRCAPFATLCLGVIVAVPTVIIFYKVGTVLFSASFFK